MPAIAPTYRITSTTTDVYAPSTALGEFIREVYLEPNDITGKQLAAKLGVSPSTLDRVLQGTSGISPEMALRLSKALGRSPESWLAMQQDYHDLWQARQTVDLNAVERIDFRAA